jgi:hypothetical protein
VAAALCRTEGHRRARGFANLEWFLLQRNIKIRDGSIFLRRHFCAAVTRYNRVMEASAGYDS